jgi:hypothetical protein
MRGREGRRVDDLSFFSHLSSPSFLRGALRVFVFPSFGELIRDTLRVHIIDFVETWYHLIKWRYS